MKNIRLLVVLLLLVFFVSAAHAEFGIKIRQASRNSISLAYGAEWIFLRTVDHPDLGNNDLSIDLLIGNDSQANYTFYDLQLIHKFFSSKEKINPFLGFAYSSVGGHRVGGSAGTNSGFAFLAGSDIKLNAGKVYLQLFANYPELSITGARTYGGLIAEIGYKFFTE